MKKTSIIALSAAALAVTAPSYAEYDFLGVEEPREVSVPKPDEPQPMVPSGFRKKAQIKPLKKVEADESKLSESAKVETDKAVATVEKIEPTTQPDKAEKKAEEPSKVEEAPDFLQVDSVAAKPVKPREKLPEIKPVDREDVFKTEALLAPDVELSGSSESDEVMSSYIKDLEEAEQAQQSARNVLGVKPQKLEIKLKPRTVAPQNEMEKAEEESEETVQKFDELQAEALADEKAEETSESEEPTQADAFVAEDVTEDDAPAEEDQAPAEATESSVPTDNAAKTTSESEVSESSEATSAAEANKPSEAENKAPEAEAQKAPFDLTWGASIDEMKAAGIELEPAAREGYQNVYFAKNLPQKNNTFPNVTVIFGAQNKLWCIYAESKAQKDDAQASQILALYHKYYDALKQKYGNAEEHFSPYEYEEKQKDDSGKTITVTKQNSIGGENFLQELKEDKTALYATFQNEQIGVMLSVAADKDGQTFLILDYKNLPLLNQEKDNKIDTILNDLEGL